MKQIIASTCGIVLLLFGAAGTGRADQDPPADPAGAAQTSAFPGGELRVLTEQSSALPFPLKHTEVHAEITGNVAQVRVTQVFQNPYDRAIEAVYVFPLPHKSAVDDMEIRIGDRTIRGDIKKREEARAVYDQARRSGRTAALLDQERPNVFTQSVANILPGEEVIVSIRYFDLLPYDSGFYEFTFPMVVAPRFVPGEPIRETERGSPPDTTDSPDASRITPPVLKPGERTGHDISLEVQLHAGTLLHDLTSPSHLVDLEGQGPGRARVSLRQEDSIPNKDFVLHYRLDGPAPEIVLLTHRTDGPGYFLMLVQPEVQPTRTRITPKEMIFVVDCSGSMSGFPIEKVKEAMRYALENLDPLDNFQIIRFSGRAESFAPEPVPATPSHIARALEYVNELSGEGGTILLDGVKTALSYKEDPQRLRIISFMTDGQIGNEEKILAYLQKHLGAARLFSFGVGSSPNRYLLDKMAEFGRGAVQYLLPESRADESIGHFYERVRSPYLTDLEVDWGDLRVSEIYPSPIPDLFLGQPVVLFGRYEQAGAGEVILRGRLGGQLYERRLGIQLPDRFEEGGAISSLWARSKIEKLSNDQIGSPQPEIIEEITDVALAHRLVSAYTSFVAVEERPRTAPEEPTLVQVPVPMPEGASYEGVYGGTPQGVVLSERLQVAARASIVNTESTTTSTTISSDMISELPVLGRDYQDVLTLAPGATGPRMAGSPNVHGARDVDVVTLVDGVGLDDSQVGQQGQQLNAASIEEIAIVTSSATTEYSRARGGFANVGPAGNRMNKGKSPTPRGGPFHTFCHIVALRESFQVGEQIELYIAIRNLSRKAVKVPVSLSVSDGTALFRILDEARKPLPQPRSPARSVKRRALLAGEWILFKVTLNGVGGYQLDRPGVYQVVLLGSELGLPDSTQVTLRIEP